MCPFYPFWQRFWSLHSKPMYSSVQKGKWCLERSEGLSRLQKAIQMLVMELSLGFSVALSKDFMEVFLFKVGGMCVVDTERCWGPWNALHRERGVKLTDRRIHCLSHNHLSLRKNTLNCDSIQSWGSFLLCESVGLRHPWEQCCAFPASERQIWCLAFPLVC